MKFVTILVTRSKSVHIKTVHSILRMNLRCVQRGDTQNEIIYCADDPYQKAELIQKQLKQGDVDRIFFIDYGVHVDDDSLAHLFESHEGVGCVVFPASGRVSIGRCSKTMFSPTPLSPCLKWVCTSTRR